MRNLLFGILIGLILGAGLLIGLPFVMIPTVISRLPNTQLPTEAAGVSQNSSQKVPAHLRFPITIALADSGGLQTAATTDLIGISPTISKVELVPTQLASTAVTLPAGQREVMNLKEPTIELMSLRGSGALAELGTAELAAGNYQSLVIAFRSLRGRKSDGSVVELPVDVTNQTVTIQLDQVWQPLTPIQLVLDIDTLASLSQSGTEYSFKPVLRRVLVNDQPLP